MSKVGATPDYTPPPTTGNTQGTSSTGGTPPRVARGDVLDDDTTMGGVHSGGGRADVPGLSDYRGDGSASVAKAIADYGSADMQGDMMAFMAIFQQIAQTLRTSYRESRHAETAAQVTSLNAAADKIIAAADLRFKAANLQADYAIAASAVSIGISVAQIGMTGFGLTKSIAGARQTQMGETVSAEAQGLTNATPRYTSGRMADAAYLKAQGTINSAKGGFYTASSQALGGLGQGISGVIKGAGDKYAAQYEKDASAQDSLGAKDQAEAKMHEAAAQTASDVMQAMQDIIRDIREKVQSMEQATVDTNKAIARNV